VVFTAAAAAAAATSGTAFSKTGGIILSNALKEGLWELVDLLDDDDDDDDDVSALLFAEGDGGDDDFLLFGDDDLFFVLLFLFFFALGGVFVLIRFRFRLVSPPPDFFFVCLDWIPLSENYTYIRSLGKK